MFYKPSSSFLVRERYQNQRKVVKHWTNYIYVIFPTFINNPPTRKERDCHDQEIADSKHKKKVIDGDCDLTNIIWDTISISPTRCLTHHVEYIQGRKFV